MDLLCFYTEAVFLLQGKTQSGHLSAGQIIRKVYPKLGELFWASFTFMLGLAIHFGGVLGSVTMCALTCMYARNVKKVNSSL